MIYHFVAKYSFHIFYKPFNNFSDAFFVFIIYGVDLLGTLNVKNRNQDRHRYFPKRFETAIPIEQLVVSGTQKVKHKYKTRNINII